MATTKISALTELTTPESADVLVINDDSAGSTKKIQLSNLIPDDAIDSEHYVAGSIDNEHLADDAVGIDELSATGTASSSTFLRGDNSWVTPTDTNTTYSVQDGELSEINFTSADHTKLNAIEASADVTDATNVTAAGALMDSELAGIAAVKATTGTFLTADQTKLDGIATGAIASLLADTSPQLGGDLDCNGAQIQWSQGADVASATALAVLTDGNYFDVTGTTTITSINTTGGVGTLIKLHFDGALTLTHDATDLILPGGANITTAAGDEAEFIEYATGDYRCTSYSKASGEAVIAGGKILQVVSETSTTASSTTSTSFVTSNLTADITPADATNKVLVLIQTVGRLTASAASSMYYTLYEDGVNIGHSTKGMGKIYTYSPEALTVDVPISIIHLASPASASAVTYTLYYGIVSSGSTAECPPDDDMIQNITLMEIAV